MGNERLENISRLRVFSFFTYKLLQLIWLHTYNSEEKKIMVLEKINKEKIVLLSSLAD